MCRLVGAEQGRETDTRVAFVRNALASIPLLLVLRPTAQLHAATISRVDGVVFTPELRARLVAEVRRVRLATIKARARTAVALAPGMGPVAREVMIGALRLPKCPHTVSELAALFGRPRSTLTHSWRVAPGVRWKRLEDFLDWVLLMEAMTLRPGMRSWGAVAKMLRVHQRSLFRSASRFLGTPLRDAHIVSALALDDDTIDQMLAQFLGPTRI